MNLQDTFLNQARMQKIPVNMYLMNGYQIKGTITGFDPFIILLDSGGKQNVIYKHAISTIMPLKPVQLFRGEETAAESDMSGARPGGEEKGTVHGPAE